MPKKLWLSPLRIGGLARAPAGFERGLRHDGARIDARARARPRWHAAACRRRISAAASGLAARRSVPAVGLVGTAAPAPAPPCSWRISMSASPRPLPCESCTASWSSIMPWYMSTWSLPNIGSPKLALRMLSSIILVKILSNWRATSRSAFGSFASAPRRSAANWRKSVALGACAARLARGQQD